MYDLWVNIHILPPYGGMDFLCIIIGSPPIKQNKSRLLVDTQNNQHVFCIPFILLKHGICQFLYTCVKI